MRSEQQDGSATAVAGRWRLDVPARADAADWVGLHLRGLAETYPQLPPAFVGRRREQQHRLVGELRDELAAPGDVRHRVARDADGTLVGIARTCPGGEAWERRLLAAYPDADALGLRRPPGLLQLSTLYTAARTHGGGVGAALFDALVGDRACYLWIMTGNPRAEAFYRRRGLARVSVVVPSGPTWFGWPMVQMARGRAASP